ncbi:MAG: hypothetical protein IPO55_00230 [Alphaproteobacteria bacterium]|nr:hypothetical protein [Alphaproteobacteria bacterium]
MTSPGPAERALPRGNRSGTEKPLVIGATGMDEEDERALQVAAENAPILYSANMSIGTEHPSFHVEQAAERLGIEWDIEIFETHHKLKVDALRHGDHVRKSRARSRAVANV